MESRMTKEQRTFIAPTDILGIEYECGHCHARNLVPLDRFDRVLHQCPNCKEGLASLTTVNDVQPKDDRLIEHLVEALSALKQLSVKIRLEIQE